MYTLEVYDEHDKFLGRKEKVNAAAIVDECFKAITYYSEKKEKVRIRLKNGDKLILETTEKHFDNDRPEGLETA